MRVENNCAIKTKLINCNEASNSGQMLMSDHNILESKLPLGRVLAGGFVLLAAVAAGTYQLTKSATSDQIGALEVQLDGLRNQIENVREPILSSDRRDATTSPEIMSEQPEELQDLVDQIATLEDEKRELQSRLASASVSALAPESELRELIENLKSDNKKIRVSAALGLHALSDSRSVPALLEYYHRDPGEATSRILPTKWIRKILRLDRDAGLDFVVQLMESEDRNTANWAYGELLSQTFEDDFDNFRPAIETLALTNEDTLVRTRAKIILKERQDWIDEKRGVEE